MRFWETAITIQKGTAFIVIVSILSFVLLVAVPFFSNGIHEAPFTEVYQGVYDPKGFPPYENSLWFIANLTAFAATAASFILLPLLIVSYVFTSRMVTKRWQMITVSACVLGIFFFLLQFTEVGQKMLVWIYD